jgi:cell division transport system ATP-binding protein
MIEVKDAYLQYPDGTVALQDIGLQIGSGETVYVTGPSGSGKTSLLKLLMGMERPTSGSVRVMGYPVDKGNPKDLHSLRTKIGPVFQEFKLLTGRTALENVMLGIRFLEFSASRLKQDAMEALSKVGLEHKALAHVENLSWGEGQRVAIARAVARRPLLILADEPTGNLDRENAVKILKLLASFKDEKTTVLITTHATHLIDAEKKCMFVQIREVQIQWKRVEG